MCRRARCGPHEMRWSWSHGVYLGFSGVRRSISEISWPTRPEDAIRLLRRYMLEVLAGEAAFRESDVGLLDLLRALISGEVSEDERHRKLADYWSAVDAVGIRDMTDKRALRARLAICILYPSAENISEIGEQLSWFIEVVGFQGGGAARAVELLGEFFDFVEEA